MVNVPDFRVRPAEREDIDALALIGAATFLDAFSSVLPGANIAAHCARHHSSNAYRALMEGGARAWLAEQASTGAPLGYAMLTTPDLPVPLGSTDLELKRIYALSQFHGYGVGPTLLGAVLGATAEMGALRLLLGVYHDNHRAIAFYRRNGFATVGTRQFKVGDGVYHDLVMAKSLNDGSPGRLSA